MLFDHEGGVGSRRENAWMYVHSISSLIEKEGDSHLRIGDMLDMNDGNAFGASCLDGLLDVRQYGSRIPKRKLVTGE